MAAVASVALIALLILGLALNEILPGYFQEQAESRLDGAAKATADLIKKAALDASGTTADQSQLENRELREGKLIHDIAQLVADRVAQGSVAVYNKRDGSLAARAEPSNISQLTSEGLRPDPAVQPASTDVAIVLPDPDPPRTAPGQQILALHVVVSSPFTSRAQTLAEVRSALLGVGVLALAVSLLIGLLLARQLTIPLAKLQRISRRLAQGQLDERTHPSGIVEVDQLGAQFNQMAERLSESLRLLEADRDRLREFIADVSHELRTPIAALRMFTELQREGEIDDGTRHEFLDRSRDQLARLEWLANNLLDLSRIEAGIIPLEMTIGDVREPIRAAVEAHAEIAETRQVALTSEVPARPVQIRYDRERMIQLATNLIGNALKFTPPGGQVMVRVVAGRDDVTVEVSDTGPGIREEELPHVFERFYRGTNVGEARASGSGLGLAIVRSIVEMHDGRIEVASMVGEGATFRVHLPRRAVAAPSPPPAADATSVRPDRVRRRLARPVAPTAAREDQ